MRQYSNLSQAFLDAAARNRDRPALCCGGQVLTYGQLRDAAASIAGMLVSKDLVKPGDRVAILSERTPVLYTGVLAALLSGAAYVPLNPRFPVERNRAMLELSEARILICDQRHQALLPDLLRGVTHKIDVVLPESAASEHHLTKADLPSDVCDDALPNGQNREDLAYVLFTSGTTGVPKGVPISHGNVLRYLASATELSGIRPDDRIIQLVDLTFDLSVHDMFMTWLNGAALYVVPQNAVLLGTRFVEEHAITGWLSVPSTAAFVKEAGALSPGCMPSLRFSFFCGEALPGAVAEGWAEAAPNSAIYNIYGPTEATVAFSFYRYQPGQKVPPAVVPLGRPLPEQHMGLFTPEGARCEEELGEICLSGSQVSKGYWRAPEISATRFFESEGRRWYRTGDLGRLDPREGYLYAGRIDRQVKIRGFRVELQEIETVLRRAVKRDVVAVVPWSSSPDSPATGCVAFVMGPARPSNAIIAECSKALPDYMVPRRIYFLPDFPLNANGKVDYAALAKMQRTGPIITEPTPPRARALPAGKRSASK